MKIKWKVAEAPTGRYRSFERRCWPMAHYTDGRPAAYITCEDAYRPANVKTGEHAELSVLIAFHHHDNPGFTWKRLKARFATLDDAKSAAQRFIDKNPITNTAATTQPSPTTQPTQTPD